MRERKDKRQKNKRDNGEEKTSKTINGMTYLASEGTMEKRTETCIEMISNTVVDQDSGIAEQRTYEVPKFLTTSRRKEQRKREERIGKERKEDSVE